MNSHYERYFYTKYEPLYRAHKLPMQESCMCWGLCIGNGWVRLLDQLSTELCADWLLTKKVYDQSKNKLGKLRYDAPKSPWNTIVTQDEIDSKYARMMIEYERVPIASQVKEKYGTLRFYADNCTDAHYRIINFAERMSSIICDVCGNSGRLNKSGWLSCRCKEHEHS